MHVITMSAVAILAGSNLMACSPTVPAGSPIRRPRSPAKVVTNQDCTSGVTDEPSVPYNGRSIVEARNLRKDGDALAREARQRSTPRSQRELLVTRAAKTYITALKADPYNVRATYSLAGIYARIGRKHCSLELLKRLVSLRRLASHHGAVADRVDRLLGQGKYRGRVDPDFSGLRADPDFRKLVNRLKSAS